MVATEAIRSISMDKETLSRAQYALLVPAGFEELCRAVLERDVQLVPPLSVCTLLPQPVLPAGFESGAAGGVAPILISTRSTRLSELAVCAPFVSVGLAHIGLGEIPDVVSSDPVVAVADLVSFFRGCRPAWESALQRWERHTCVQAGPRSASQAEQSNAAATSNGIMRNAQVTKFRVAVIRGGKHSASSRAFAGALGELIGEWQPDWKVDFRSPDVTLLCLLIQGRAQLGIVLPPYRSKSSDAMPEEPSRYLVAGIDRPHMRHSRAAALALLLAPATGDVVLDPCGGIGMLTIAAALGKAIHALSMDVDYLACHAAWSNSQTARKEGELLGYVDVCQADTSSGHILRPGSVDGVIADLPYGRRHAKMDVGALIRWLAQLLRPGGRAVLLGGAGSTGTAAACIKSARRWPVGGWHVEREMPCQAGGIACKAIVLLRLDVRLHADNG